jgi:hypothetical protein
VVKIKRFINTKINKSRMGLEDKFYPDDGTTLTAADNALIRTAGKVGEAYQHLTGRSYNDLVDLSYKITGFLAIGTSFFNPLLGPFVHYASKDLSKAQRYSSPLEEEIHLEAKNLPTNLGKWVRMMQAIGIPACAYLFGSITYEVRNEHPVTVAVAGGAAAAAIAYVPAIFAQYLSLADIPKPPEKTVFRRIGDTIGELFTAPAPVPVRIDDRR